MHAETPLFQLAFTYYTPGSIPGKLLLIVARAAAKCIVRD